MKKPKTYWAMFVDGEPYVWTFGGRVWTLNLFTNRKKAKKSGDDVRKVKIVEVK